VVSLIGFLPDVFFGLVTGHLIDSSPGVLGYSHSFLFTGCILLIGTMASHLLSRKSV